MIGESSGYGAPTAFTPVPLADPRARDRTATGGKASQLATLLAASVAVPPGFVIPVGALREALWRAGLQPLAERAERDPDAARELHGALERLTLPDDVATAWIAAARALGPVLAVRSSGVDEDGGRRSFAGQYRSVLGVAPEGVPAAVVAVWASRYGRSALAYRARGSDGPSPGLAVLVQKQVAPASSGVMFTINPANGSWREMVVEAVWGLAEGLASGQVAPHWYLVRRPRDLPLDRALPGARRRWAPPRLLARAAARVRVHVVDRDLPELTERIVSRGGGTVSEPVPASLHGRPTLESTAVRRLCRLGLAIERELGGPQDIEWVREPGGGFVVVQARPITTTADPRSQTVLWTRRFLGERWPEPATPLGWSLVGPILDWLVAYPETQAALLGGGPALKLVHGRPYVNATVFRHLAFKLPGAPPPSFMLELVPPDEARAWHQRFAVAPNLAVYRSILRTTVREQRWKRFRWNPFTNPDAWDAFQARLEAELPALSAAIPGPAEAVARVDAHLDWFRSYASIHLCSLLFANIAWQLLDSALSTWLPEDASARRAELMEGLAVSPPGNLTVATNDGLWALAQVATDGDLDALAAGELAALSSPFRAVLDGFLDRYGQRSEASWELTSPRWRTHPERLAPLIRAQRGGRVEAPRERAAAQERRFDQAMAELRETLSGAPLAVTEGCVRYTRRYLLLRENQRFWFDRLSASLAEALRWLGGWAAGEGLISSASDAVLLTWDELRACVEGPRDPGLRALVEVRRAQREADLRADPPTFLLGDDTGDAAPPGLREGAPPGGLPTEGRRFQGLGISGGRIRGRARVVRTLAEGDQLLRGEILVARAVDPAWTPLFLTAGGAVLELGSMLSHGAVVAREYRIPAVVNIDDATRALRTGDDVTVDGTRGIVWVHPPPR